MTSPPIELIDKDQWRPFPRAVERTEWEALLEEPANTVRRDGLVALAEELAGQPAPALPASAFMAFMRTGDRTGYQNIDGQRRRRLSVFTLAECFEHAGRFVDPLIDQLWAFCEQSTWCWPAHDGARLLTDVTDPVPDLAATHIAFALAEVAYLLGDELDAVSPTVRERIRLEVDRRILTPFLEQDDIWWLGFKAGREVNNWTAVCNAGVVAAAMHLENDAERLARIVARSLESMEHFLGCYGPDGGCDEGPAYWGYGVGHLVLYAELILSRTGGRVNLYDDPRVKAMAEFPHRVHLAGPYFVNFADCSPRVTFNRAQTRRYAERVGSDGLLALASQQSAWTDTPPDVTDGVRQLFWDRPALTARPIPKQAAVWFPDLQWMIARHEPESAETLVVAAKAGHNAEKHNHNDGGAFAVYLAGEPMIIDMGSEEYTRFTFSAQRYERLAMRSLGHDVPLVRGVEQAPGRQFAAADVVFEADEGRAVLSQELSGLYPTQAGVQSWVRRIELLREAPAGCVRVTDRFALKDPREAMLVKQMTSAKADGAERPVISRSRVGRGVAVPLYTHLPCRAEGPGRVFIEGARAGLVVEFAPDELTAELEPLPLDDKRLQAAWGESLTRIWLRPAAAATAGQYALTFTPAVR